jgi:hypothetical protein
MMDTTDYATCLSTAWDQEEEALQQLVRAPDSIALDAMLQIRTNTHTAHINVQKEKSPASGGALL